MWYRSMMRSAAMPLGAALVASVVVAVHAGPAEVKQWQKDSEAEANGLTDANAEQYKRLHKLLVDACGHDVHVEFDWKSYDPKDWTGPIGGACIQDVLDAVEYYCSSKDNAAYKPALAKLQTLSCHYKPCDKLPRSKPDDPKSGPGIEYKLTHKGRQIDKYSCKESSIYGDYDARRWLKHTL